MNHHPTSVHYAAASTTLDASASETRCVWDAFTEISAIPRGSKNEGRVRDYLKNQATLLGLKSDQDDAGNLAIYIPATEDQAG